MQRARLYVDSRANARREAGELLLPLQQETIDSHQVLGELADLCRMTHPPLREPGTGTVFKVGTALADLLCAQQVLARLSLIEP